MTNAESTIEQWLIKVRNALDEQDNRRYLRAFGPKLSAVQRRQVFNDFLVSVHRRTRRD